MKRKATLILILVLLFTLNFGAADNAMAATDSRIEQILQKTGDYIYWTVKEPACSAIGGEWAMYGLALAGHEMSDAYIAKYQKSVEKTVKEGYRGTPGILHDRKYSEYSRVIFTYGKLGLDPTNVAGYDLLEKLADYEKVIWQGINGPVWALKALDSGSYDMPKAPQGAVQATRNMYIDFILNEQLPDGGWDFSSKSADPDMTAMAVQALAPYRNKTKVKKAVDNALTVLSKMQESNGGYSSGGISNCESCAQVIWALALLGIDANDDARFIKNGKSPVDALLTFCDKKTGGFRHVNVAQGGYEAEIDQLATEQAYYALASYCNDVAKARITKLSESKSGSLKVTWESQQLADGYEVMIATDKNFKKNTKKSTATNKNAAKAGSTISKSFSKLQSGKTYYARVRAYRTINGKKVYGVYSNVKKLKL